MTVYQIVAFSAVRCSSKVGTRQWIVTRERVRQGRDRLLQQVEDHTLDRPSQRLRQSFDLLPGCSRKADEAITHEFPTRQQAALA
jgi:hypothetical protein